jgi:HlyD family secretion protein
MSHLHQAARAAGAIGPLAALVLGVALLVQGCSSKEEKDAEANVTVQAATAEKATIEDEISADAILYPRDQAAIVPRVNAPIKKFFVDRGSKVRAGQLLAELESSDLAGAVTENQGGYQQAQASYNSALQSAKQDLNTSKEQLDAAQKLYDGRQSLYKQGAMAAKDVEDARIALTQAKNQYDLAEKAYTLKAAEGQLTAAKGKTISAEAQLSYTKIVSPINGVVTDRPFFAGETAPSGSAILTVMDLSKVVARAFVSPQQAAQLHVGDAATVVAESEQSEIPAKVTVVSPALDPNSTTVQVWVEALNPGGKLRSGSSVKLDIVSKTVKDALVVPAEAILTGADRATTVMVIDKDGKAHQTAVATGIRNDHQVQILSGLEAGQQVVTSGAYGLPDGTKVTVSKGPEPKGADSKGGEPD